MIVAGVMSGTSADGINVALVEISGAGFDTRFKLLAHREYPYPRPVRRAVLAAMNAGRASVADLARLNFLLGELYAAAVLATQKKVGVNVELVGCHGQTIYHQGEAAPYLGKKITATWQTGEGAVIAARVGAPVVSDFRPADMAAGGKGAPLVPFLDYLVYRDARVGRIVQNLGGIANLTAIPAGASPKTWSPSTPARQTWSSTASWRGSTASPMTAMVEWRPRASRLRQSLNYYLNIRSFGGSPRRPPGGRSLGVSS